MASAANWRRNNYLASGGSSVKRGGGLWVFYQDADGSPVRTRHQLTTDTTSVLTKESSIIDALDYAAKTARTTFRNFIGRYNITTSLLEALNLVCDALRDFFVQNQVFTAWDVVGMEQSETNTDEIYLIVDVVTQKPFNKLRITFRVT